MEGVALVLRFPMEESIVEYQWSFPEVSPRPKSDGKAHGGYQIRSKSVECRLDLQEGGVNPARDPQGEREGGELLPSNLGVGGQRRSKSIWKRTCSLISVETRGECAKRSIPRP